MNVPDLDGMTQHCCTCVGCTTKHWPQDGCVCGGAAVPAPLHLRIVLPPLPDAIETLTGHRIPLGALTSQAVREIAAEWERRLIERVELERARLPVRRMDDPARRHEACAHIFEANYGLNDSHHRYCTKCGILEDAARDRALPPTRPQVSVERPPATDERALGLNPGKFKVERADGDPTGKHRHCAYFVLDLAHDPHAVPALEAYAASCEIDGYGPLAADLREFVARRRARLT